jgi:hypothetical protein
MKDWTGWLGGYSGKVYTSNQQRLAEMGLAFVNAHDNEWDHTNSLAHPSYDEKTPAGADGCKPSAESQTAASEDKT